MKPNLFKLLLLFIMLSTTSETNAFSYKKSWQRAEELISQDLPESAHDVVLDIYNHAWQKKNSLQLLKATYRLSSLEREFLEEADQASYNRLKEIQPRLKGEYRGLGIALQANYLREYYSNAYWSIQRRSTLSTQTENIDDWDQATIKNAIDSLLLESISDRSGLASKKKAEKYKEILILGNKQGIQLRPTLQDVLLQNAIWDQATEDWNSMIIERLMQLNQGSSADILASIQLERLNLRTDYRHNDEKLQLALDLFEEYHTKTAISSEFAAIAADLYRDRNENLKADSICQMAIEEWPESSGAYSCHIIQRELHRKSADLNFLGTQSLIPMQENLIYLSHENISHVWMRAIPCDDAEEIHEINDLEGLEQISTLYGMEAAAIWEQDLDQTGDLKNHTSYAHVPALKPGRYFILASDTEIPDTTTSFTYTVITTTDLLFAGIATRDRELSGYAVHQKDGRPAPGCKYGLYTYKYGSPSGTETDRLLFSGVTDAEGFLHIEGIESNVVHVLLLEDGDNKCLTRIDPFSEGYKNIPSIVRLITDRYTYRPGDQVYYKGLLYNTDGYSKGQTVSEQRVTVLLRDVNWQVIATDTLYTDEFGSVSGSFRIPQDRITGRYSLQISEYTEGVYYTRPINVEEYRQPTFEIELEEASEECTLGSDITVNGKVTSLTGVSVQEASVSYTVTRRQITAFRSWSHVSEDQILFSTETTTDSEGNFCIKFKADAPEDGEEESYSFLVRAFITAADGETHESNISVTASDIKGYLNISAPDQMLSSSEVKLSISNLDGRLMAGQVHLTIDKLQQPEKPLILTGLQNVYIPEGIASKFPSFDLDGHTQIENLKSLGTVAEADVNCTDSPEPGKYSLLGLSAGSYRMTASVISESKIQADTIYFTIETPEERLQSGNLLTCLLPKDSYEVGQTAQIFLGTNLPGSHIYYSISDRYGIYSHGAIETDGTLQTLNIPVTETMVGGIYVSLCAVTEGVSQQETRIISVPFTEKKLDISFHSFRNLLEPDQKETWRLRITDYQGRPVKAQLVASMYDSSLDSFGRNDWTISPWTDTRFSYKQMINYPWNIPGGWSYSEPYDYTCPESLEFTTIPGGFGITYRMNGRIGGLSVMKAQAMESSVLEDAVTVPGITFSDMEIEKELPAEIALRTDLDQTAFFMPDLVTDKNGYIDLTFTAPQLLTRWNVQGFAHTEKLQTGIFMRQVTTRKQLMVVPNAPKFVRQGDRLQFSATVSNLTDTELRATVRLSLTEIGYESAQQITLAPQQTAPVTFTAQIPVDAPATLTYRITAQAPGFSDGQQDMISVINRRQMVTESLSLYANGAEKRTFTLQNLLDSSSKSSIQDQTLKLEYAQNPVWYAIKALPWLSEETSPDNIRLFHRFYAAAVAGSIMVQNPEIRNTIRTWANEEPDALLSRLETSSRLMGTALQEAPWLFESQSQSGERRRMAEFYDRQHNDSLLKVTLDLLLSAQCHDGGWGWIKGYESNTYTTAIILRGIGQLMQIGAVSENRTPRIHNAVCKAAEFLDNEYNRTYQRIAKDNAERDIYDLDLLYLCARHLVMGIAPVSESNEAAFNYFMSLADKHQTQADDLYFRAMLMQLFLESGQEGKAQHIAATLIDRSLYSEEMGRYWRDNTAGYLWRQAPVELQSEIILALNAAGYTVMANQCRQWLLKQKQTTHWSTSSATANAVMALLSAGPEDQLTIDSNGLVDITVGTEIIQKDQSEAGTGYITRIFDEVTPDMANVTVDSRSHDISWGALHWQYTQPVQEVQAAANGFSIKRSLYVIKDEVLYPATDIHVGDRIRVRIEISADRTVEYVQVKDSRAAAFQPASTASGIRYNMADDLRYYVAPGVASTSFYIDRLPKGRFLIEYDMYAERGGTYTCGTASISSMYAPEFGAHTVSEDVIVKD